MFQVSDAVVDHCFAADPKSREACETCTGTNFVMVFGEITTKADMSKEKVEEVRKRSNLPRHLLRPRHVSHTLTSLALADCAQRREGDWLRPP